MPATIYLGAPGSGKTFLMRSHVEAISMEEGAPVIVGVDHGEKPGHPSWKDLPGVKMYRSIPEWWYDPCRLAFFQGVPPLEVARLAIEIGWSIYVDDECDDIVRDGKWNENPLREIVKRGRHLANRAGVVTEVHAMLATHRPANLPTDVQGLFDRVYIGYLYAFNDADRLYREGWVGEPSVQEVQRRISSLTVGQFLWWPQ